MYELMCCLALTLLLRERWEWSNGCTNLAMSESGDVSPSYQAAQGLKVAMTALQLVEGFKLNNPLKEPVEVTISVSVALRDAPVFSWRSV